MLFALGYIAGLATCIFIAVLLAYFRRPLLTTMAKVERIVPTIGVQQRGFIFEPESEATEARHMHIAKNAELGKDTPIEELL